MFDCNISQSHSLVRGIESWILNLSSCCRLTVGFLCLFVMVSLIGLQCVNVIFHDNTHLFEEERAGYFTWSNCCRVAAGVFCLFLTVQLIGLLYVIVTFPDLTHLFYGLQSYVYM